MMPQPEGIDVGDFDIPTDPLERAAQQARATHRRLEGIDDWECAGFDPAASADGELVYCANCSAIVWRAP